MMELGPAEPSPSSLTTGLACGGMVIAALAALAAAAGLLWPSDPASQTEIISVYGETVALFGHGLNRHDSLLFGAGFRGRNVVTLFLAAPALLVASWRARGGTTSWVLVRTALLSLVLYA